VAEIDVDKAIGKVLARANRKFNAAMDELVPPTPEQKLARDYPQAVALANIVHAFNSALRNFGEAYAATMRQLDTQGRRDR
jgi:hypothetical protein